MADFSSSPPHTDTSFATMTAPEESIQQQVQGKSLESSFSGIDLSEFSTPSKKKPAQRNQSYRERLKRNAQQRSIQDQEELKLAAAIQASRVTSKPSSKSLGDLLVGMHDQEQSQESRMKLSKKRPQKKSRPAKQLAPPKKKTRKNAKY